MIALPYIVFFGVYLLLSGWLTDWAARKAKARGIAGWKWGLPMALVMYNLVFWDWVPMEAMFKYDCATESGFTVYKTLDEWKRENPRVAETLDPEYLPKEYLVGVDEGLGLIKKERYHLPNGAELTAFYGGDGRLKYTEFMDGSGNKGYWLNQRFVQISDNKPLWLHIWKRDERIVDTKTGEVLAQYVDFGTDIQGVEVGYDKTLSDYKVWLGKGSCEKDGQKVNRKDFYKYKYLMKHQKEFEQ